MPDPSTRPSFAKPPVVETVMGVHFRPLPGFQIAERVLFWTKLRDDVPVVEERRAVDEIQETFGRGESKVQFRWEVSEAPPQQRLWAKSTDGKHTVQIQQNALLVNWERDATTAGVRYMPYEERRDDFVEKLSLLEDFLRENELGHIEPTSCFATYINHIEYRANESHGALCARLLSVWRNQTSDGWLPEAEDATVKLAYQMPEEAGRLHVSLVPAIRRSDSRQIVRLDLTARGPAMSPSIPGAIAVLDLAHDWIVRGFASITTSEMHTEWGRQS